MSVIKSYSIHTNTIESRMASPTEEELILPDSASTQVSFTPSPVMSSPPSIVRQSSVPKDFAPVTTRFEYTYQPEDGWPLQQREETKTREPDMDEMKIDFNGDRYPASMDGFNPDSNPTEPLQVTVLQQYFDAYHHQTRSGYSQEKKRSHCVRLVLINNPDNGASTCYVHLLDLLTLIHHPFGAPLTQVNINTKPYFKQLKSQMIMLVDENMEPELTPSSTTTISMRAKLVPLRAYRELLAHPHIQKLVSKRIAYYGNDYNVFLQVTLMCSLQVHTYGPQPKPSTKPTPDEEQEAGLNQKKNRCNSNPIVVDADSLPNGSNSSSAGEEWYVHCILCRVGHLYQVHWSHHDGTPFSFDDPGGCTWEYVKKIEIEAPLMVEDFNQHKRCPAYLAHQRIKRKDKLERQQREAAERKAKAEAKKNEKAAADARAEASQVQAPSSATVFSGSTSASKTLTAASTSLSSLPPPSMLQQMPPPLTPAHQPSISLKTPPLSASAFDAIFALPPPPLNAPSKIATATTPSPLKSHSSRPSRPSSPLLAISRGEVTCSICQYTCTGGLVALFAHKTSAHPSSTPAASRPRSTQSTTSTETAADLSASDDSSSQHRRHHHHRHHHHKKKKKHTKCKHALSDEDGDEEHEPPREDPIDTVAPMKDSSSTNSDDSTAMQRGRTLRSYLAPLVSLAGGTAVPPELRKILPYNNHGAIEQVDQANTVFVQAGTNTQTKSNSIASGDHGDHPNDEESEDEDEATRPTKKAKHADPTDENEWIDLTQSD